VRFIDEAKIKVSAGHGGPGSVSFRRETFIPRGGPDGGDGGAGGDVIFEASSQLSTLQDFRFKREYSAPAGMHGSGANKAGKDGEDILIKVPVGTLIKETETGEILADFTENRQTWVACKGGRGGKGNAHFVTSTHQAPRFAQPGEEGEYKELTLELKLLADVAIIGFPNAGKSTLISRISAARPKIADYPFTTLTPNLGVVSLPEHQSFVVADIPGLIEGAHKGHGLGHKFLRHMERTRLFIHLLDGTQLLEDMTGPQSREENLKLAVEHIVERYKALRTELGLFNEKLLHKPEVVVINKLDLFETDAEFVQKAKTALRQQIHTIRGTFPCADEPFLVSGVSGNGISELLFFIQEELKAQKAAQPGGADEAPILLPSSEELRK